jgi:acetyl coenzyme A synthetase (ADP forming)-like protein
MRSSIDPFFRPSSIAVIGASRSPGTIGYQIVHNLLTHGYTGVLYPVNPKAAAVHSVPAFPSIMDIPGPVELAVIAVPKERVLDVARECAKKGVKALVVISAGFREVGGAGVERERALVELTRRYGMRLVGPNCMGVLSTDPAFSMNATFAPSMPPTGSLSFMSQSGALGVTILDYASEFGIGIRHFVSVGNKPDVSGNDLIEYWGEDEGTRVILMYIEHFGNPKHFTRLARAVSRKKPIVVVKSGRTAAGARAASSHTGALAGAEVAIDALLEQCGVMRAESVEELFDMALAFGHLPVPKGNRVAILTNAGGPGIMIADACESTGLSVVELSPEIQARLRDVLPEEASVRNPVDMVASATPESYRTALEIVLEDPNVDAAIAAFVPPLGVRQEDVAECIVAASSTHSETPVLAVLMGREGLPQGRLGLREHGIPAYIFPESAARSLAAMHRYAQWRARPPEEARRFDVDSGTVARIVDEALAEGREHLSEREALAVFECYGIPTIGYRTARDADEAVAAAQELGFPVVMKVLSPDVIHKSDVGGVAVDLRSPEEIREAFQRIMEAVAREVPEARVQGVLLEQFIKGGRETIIGVSHDPAFGPIVMFGLGGIYVEGLKDVVFRVHPVTRGDASEMVRSLRGGRILEGLRGEPGVDFEGLSEVVERVSQLVGDHERIVELDINPFLAFDDGGVAVDARIRVTS